MPMRGNMGSSGQSNASLTYQRLSFDLDKLQKAKLTLQQAGFIVTIAPIELWPFRCVLVAHNPQTGEGYLIGPDELGLICHYGVDYLNPHEFVEPRYKAKDNSNRIRHYAEAAIARACTDVALSAPGTSNMTLNKAAYTLGRFAFGWQLDPDSLQAQLLGVALDRGINEHEARAVIKAGFKGGSKSPRDPSEIETEQRSTQPQDAETKHLNKLQRKMDGYK
jgi:hypothetical protein